MSQRNHRPIRDPQKLEALLIARADAGDIDGMVALDEPNAVVAIGGGQLARGTNEIRQFFANLLATGFVFHAGEQYPRNSERPVGAYLKPLPQWHHEF